MTSKTVVSIVGDDFYINGEPTYEGRVWRGHRIEGLLMNSRMVQGVFDDLNPATRSRWDYPDGKWDAERNTDRFVEAMPIWRRAGLLSFTVNFQGGSPEGYSKTQPWHNSAFEADGSLRGDYAGRMGRILDAADELGMAPIVGLFYFGQDHRLDGDAAVMRACDEVTEFLVERGDRHVLVEIGNEVNLRMYTQPLIKAERCHELIERVQARSEGKVDSPAGRLLASTSYSGNVVPEDHIIAAGDFVLPHGNSVKQPERIREMVKLIRESKVYRGQPIVFNEDDHYEFDQPDNNMLAAIGEHASWGFFDYRRAGEPFEEGYQSVPTDWGISSERKRAFFGYLAEVTGGMLVDELSDE